MDVETDLYRDLARPGGPPMVLLVVDGLSCLPAEPAGTTPLEAAHTPTLDDLARHGICGLHEPVGPGVTPGRGAALLALLGYDPLKFVVGRGVLAALGADLDLRPHDVAIAGRFATVADDLTVQDLSAGHLTLADTEALCALLAGEIRPDGVECQVRALGANQFALLLRGSGLSGDVDDTDPLECGQPVAEPKASSAAGRRTARLAGQFVAQARQALQGRGTALMPLLSGFSRRPAWPTLEELYGLRSAAITACPLGRGAARLAGMTPIAVRPGLAALDALTEEWPQHDLYLVHLTRGQPEAEGEDETAARQGLVRWIEQVDAALPRLPDLGVEVLAVTGDRSTAEPGRYASWHAVPVVLWAPTCRTDDVVRFGERACAHGTLGPRFRTAALLPLLMAHALRLDPYGA